MIFNFSSMKGMFVKSLKCVMGRCSMFTESMGIEFADRTDLTSSKRKAA